MCFPSKSRFLRRGPDLIDNNCRKKRRLPDVEVRDASAIEGQNCGIASQPSHSRQPLCIVLRKLFRERDCFFFLFFIAFFCFLF